MSNVDVPQIVELGTGLIGTIAGFFNPAAGGIIVTGGKAVASGLRGAHIGTPDEPKGPQAETPKVNVAPEAIGLDKGHEYYYDVMQGTRQRRPVDATPETEEDKGSTDDETPAVSIHPKIFNLSPEDNPAGVGRGVDDPDPAPPVEIGGSDNGPVSEPQAARSRILAGLFGRRA